MYKRVCPWWLGYFLASPIRRLLSGDPAKLLSPHIRPGMTVLEPGPGMGFFTLALARLVGHSGRVVAVDVQPKMLSGLKRRAAKADLLDRIDARLAPADSMGIADLSSPVDFTLAFAVVHEMPSADSFFAQVAAASRPAAQILFVEPAGHVKLEEFNAELGAAARSGFSVVDRPFVRRSHAVLLRKSA